MGQFPYFTFFRNVRFCLTLFIAFGMALPTAVLAQTSDKAFGQVNIASPNAAALGKFGDIPVSYHTGVPNISIPLYTLQEGSLSVPVSISYHSGGIKVDETASNVGLGWALNAGGVITRTVRDRADEQYVSAMTQQYGFFSDYGIAGQYREYGYALTPGVFDGEPDFFFFNFNGHSGKFFFNDDRTPMISPQTDLKIEYSYHTGTWYNSPGAWAQGRQNINSFIITTPDGTKYYFGIPTEPVNTAVAATLHPGFCDPIEVVSNFIQVDGTAQGQVISSWYLNKIVSADGNSVVTFSYVRDRFATYAYSNPDIYAVSGTGGNLYPYMLAKNLNAGVRLRRIQGSTVKVDFLPGISRQDLSQWTVGPVGDLIDTNNYVSTPGDTTSSTALGAVQISTRSGTCIKKFVFKQDYFVDAAGETVHTNFSGLTYDKKKLRLKSIQEMSCDTTVKVQPYTFQYFTERVPRSFSFGRDHWGFINGVTTNPSLYPQMMSGTTNVNSVNSLGVADRDSHWPAVRGGTLSRITYPTGGYSNFNFEPNKYTIAPIVNGQVTHKDVLVGGLRIKSIDNYDAVSNTTTTTNYTYTGEGSTLSSGVLFSQPNYIQILWNDFWSQTYRWSPYAGWGCSNPQNPILDCVISEHSLRQMSTTQGCHIGYNRVVVGQTGNGQTVYKYYASPVITDNTTVAQTNISDPSACISTIKNYPPAPPQEDYMRGELSYEGVYDQSGNLLQEKFHTPLFVDGELPVFAMATYKYCPSDVCTPAYTYYDLYTGRKTQETLIEKTYQPGGTVLIDTTQTFYGSGYHTQPTMIVKSAPDGRSLITKMTYTFDLQVPTVNSTPACTLSDFGIDNYRQYVFYMNAYQYQFQGAWDANGYWDFSKYGTAIYNWNNDVANYWNTYVDCRKTNYTNPNLKNLNTFQVNHNAGKFAADATLSPILWAQDAYINTPIEVTTWRGSSLTGATYTTYENTRNDGLGVHPKKTSKIRLQVPSSTFTPAALNTGGTAVVLDTRYADDTQAGFVFGHLSRVTGRDGVPTSYDWGFNTYPTVKASNASNNLYETPAAGIYNPTFPVGGDTTKLTYSFYQTATGSVTLGLPQTPPSEAAVTMVYSLVGAPNSTSSSAYYQSSTLCNSTYSSCGTTASSVVFSSVPPGLYLLACNIHPSYNSGATTTVTNTSISLNYQGATTTSTKEYFFEGFEENTNATAISGSAHSGGKYWNANYTNSFSKPNSRNYTIQWWNLSGGQWIFNQQTYTNSQVLTGPVDDVRIFPSDALMETYTHQPGIGATSHTDAAGVTTYYYYDKLARLSYVTDQSGKIIKQYTYNYSH